MDCQDRIREIAESAGLEIRDPGEMSPSERCWVDARVKCPYGSPEGQFINRPEVFCNKTCRTFNLHLEGILDERVDEQGPSVVRTYFENNCTKVSGELLAQADTMLSGTTERLILELAADVLRDRKLDRHVLLEDDLPAE